MKIKKQFFSGVVRAFWISLAGVLVLSLAMVNPVRADGVPDLTVASTHSGVFSQGGAASYTITVTNLGTATGSTDGITAVTVTDTLPAGLTATGMGGDGWTCPVPVDGVVPPPLTCTRTDVSTILTIGNSYPDITLDVAVDPDAAVDAPYILVNEVTVDGGGEANTSNNIDSDDTTITQKPDLEITMVDSGDFVQGGVDKTYTITVKNVGHAPTNGTAIIVDDFSVDADLTVKSIGGTNWTCVGLVCTRDAGHLILDVGSSFETITLTVDVHLDAGATVTNQADLSGSERGGDLNTTNNSASKAASVIQKPDLTVKKEHTGNFIQGGVGTYTITIKNSNLYVPTDDTEIAVTDTLPAGLTATDMSGNGWTCPVPVGGIVPAPLTCTHPGVVLAAGASLPDVITVTVNVAVNAAASITNTVTVSGGGQVNNLNDSGSDLTTIVPMPDLDLTNVNLTPNPPILGQGFVAQVTGLNRGGAGSGSIVSVYAFVDPDTDPAHGLWPLTCGWVPDNYNFYTSDLELDAPIGAGLPINKDVAIGGLSAGTHKIYFYADPDCIVDESDEENNDFGPVNITVIVPPAPAGAGVYDDVHVNWSYTGAWTAASGIGPWSNTMHMTTTMGNSASFAFNGTQFILSYGRYTNRGKIDVYMDGSKIATIDANGALQWQKTYVSPVFALGTHVVQFKHGGGGTFIDLDAIQILSAPAPGAGIYDDGHGKWSYAGAWAVSRPTFGPLGSGTRYTATIGNSASFVFTGKQFIFTYTRSPNRGKIDVYLDGSKLTTINANGTLIWQKTYVSPVFTLGTHVVRFQHAGGGALVDVDAIQILAAPALGAGVYDDVNANWSYYGNWTAARASGPRSNTTHVASIVGSTASFTFTGRQFILTYTRNTSRGNIDVYLDGTKVTTINARGTLLWQKIYVSPVFALGTHVVQFRGTSFDVDALQILAAPAPGAATYDDIHPGWAYVGSWLAKRVSGPRSSTMHINSYIGSEVSFAFTGKQFILFYTQDTNRGKIDVYVDGSKVTTITAKGTLKWQKTYTSPVFPIGTHVVRFRHAGSGTYIDVDAITVK